VNYKALISHKGVCSIYKLHPILWHSLLPI